MTVPFLPTLLGTLLAGGMLLVGSPSAGAALPSDTSLRLFRGAMRTVEQFTGRPFRDSVPLRPQSRGAFQRYVQSNLRNTYRPGELKHLASLYYLLGLFPKEYPLRSRLVTLYREQAGAYYDPRTGSIHTLMEDLSPASRRFIYRHELIHAQQDQYFDLGDHMERIRRAPSLDRQRAFQFVIEGHANLVATASRVGVDGMSERFFRSKAFGRLLAVMARLPEVDASRFGLLARSVLPEGTGVLSRSLRRLEAVPWILVQQLVDPYFLGQKRWFERGRRIGWARAESWLENPPATTREVLYPEPDTGLPFRSPPDPGGDDLYRNRPGVYLLLRWMGRLAKRPAWGRRTAVGPAVLIRRGNDRVLAWSLAAPKSTRDELLRDLAGALDPGDTSSRRPGRFQGREGPRYLRVESRDGGLILWFDDDPDLEPGVPWEEAAESIPTRPAMRVQQRVRRPSTFAPRETVSR